MKIAIIDKESAMVDILDISEFAMETAVEQWCGADNEGYYKDDIETYLRDVLGYSLDHIIWMLIDGVREFNCHRTGATRVDNSYDHLYFKAGLLELAEFHAKVKSLYAKGKFVRKRYGDGDSEYQWEYKLPMVIKHRPIIDVKILNLFHSMRVDKIIAPNPSFANSCIRLEGESLNDGRPYSVGLLAVAKCFISRITVCLH